MHPRDPHDAPREALRGSWIVVEGVIEAESIFGMRVRVERTYAGSAERTIALPGQGNANRVGTPWTFYVRRSFIAYDYTDCGGSHPWSLTPEERTVLGAGQPPRPDEPLFGTVGNTIALGALMALLLIVQRTRRRGPPLRPAGAHP